MIVVDPEAEKLAIEHATILSMIQVVEDYRARHPSASLPLHPGGVRGPVPAPGFGAAFGSSPSSFAVPPATPASFAVPPASLPAPGNPAAPPQAPSTLLQANGAPYPFGSPYPSVGDPSMADAAGLGHFLGAFNGHQAGHTQATPIARLVSELVLKLTRYPREYINFLLYSSDRREAVELLATKRNSNSLSMVNGSFRVCNDQDSDVVVGSSWDEYRSGFMFVVKTMLTLPARAADVPDLIEFLTWVETECPVPLAKRIQYVSLCALRFKDLRDWVTAARGDTALLFKTCWPGAVHVPSGSTPGGGAPTIRAPPRYEPPASKPLGKTPDVRLAPKVTKKAKKARVGSKWPPTGEYLSYEFPGDTCLSRVMLGKPCG